MDIKEKEQYAKELIKICGYSSKNTESRLYALLYHQYAAIALYETASAASKNTESRLYALLYHQYAAIALYETASAADRSAVDAVAKRLKSLISIKFKLKERGGRKKEKQENAPTPPKEEIENKEETAKKTSVSASREVWVLDERQKAFWKELSQYIDKPYDLQLVQSFFY